ncbi:hypothetical protein HaLaN_16481 [Haematococcus lacustris]|uniref:Uncharacterized protein n=1 Tax=Haematococcus lacustris TaxID=44745 RepID=A0A699ZL38_HAELA|nr:hypothetical protein HaLaN_16481 [Haematococcus lacustris]
MRTRHARYALRAGRGVNPDAAIAMPWGPRWQEHPSLHRIIEGVRASMREQREQQEPPAPKLTPKQTALLC